MVKAGLTPMQALVAATSGAARASKLDQVPGNTSSWQNGGLRHLERESLTDIRNTRQIDSVWIGGRRLSANGGQP